MVKLGSQQTEDMRWGMQWVVRTVVLEDEIARQA